MARGTLSENERCCLDSGEKPPEGLEIKNDEVKPNGLRVRFLDEEGKTERLVSTDEVDCVAHVKKIHFLKSRSSSETSLLLRNNSLVTRRGSFDTNKHTNNNCLSENLNRASILKHTELEDKTDKIEQTKDSNSHYKKHTNVYSVNQAKTLTPERRKSLPTIPRLMSNKDLYGSKSSLPAEVCMADAAFGKDFTARTLGRLSRGLSRLLRRTNSVSISEPDPVYKVAYLGNVLTGWARGETCIEKPLATLWRNYQQFNKPDVVMKLSVTNSGLKGFTKEHGLTEYWSHRITYCASPPHYPKLFCWVYRHEGKKLKHELRCHAVLCTKETVSKKITEELQVKLKQALAEFKKTMLSKQNARLSLANSVYENPSMPRRKILLSVGATNYRPPLERSKSAPKLGAIEEMCSEEDEEEAEMNAKKEPSDSSEDDFCTQTLDRRRWAMNSPRKMSCPSAINRVRTKSHEIDSDDIIQHLIEESNKTNKGEEISNETSQNDERFHRLESIDESSETNENADKILLSQSNFLVTDSDDGSVSSGCETASTVNSDTEPSSLPPHYPQDEARCANARNPDKGNEDVPDSEHIDEVNHVPIGEKNFKRRSTYPPLKTEAVILADFEIDNLDFDSLNSCNDGEVLKNSGDNESACSDESGYSELLDGKESVIGSTIMV